MPGKRCANRTQCFRSALHDIVPHRAVDMNVQVGRNEGGFGVSIARFALVAAIDRGDAPVVDGDSWIFDELVAVQEAACGDSAGHSGVPFSSTGKDIAMSKMPRNESRRQGRSLGGELENRGNWGKRTVKAR